jgi:tripartite-type tricarboxylate transporter receptor subunit TctC
MPAPVAAQDFPTKPIKLIVPFPPGGPNDIIARVVGQRMTELTKQPIIIENRSGQAGVLGTDAVAKAAPDGYTIGIVSASALVINPFMEKTPYDVARDIAPVTLNVTVPEMLVVASNVPANNMAELIALAKAQPGKLKIGSAGNGSGTHLMAELFMRGAGVELTHVPYKGAGPAVTATVGGEMDAVFTSMPAAVTFVQSGRLRPIGVTTAQRHPSHPEVPTFEESGVPNMVLHHWFGVLAPAGLMRPIRDRLTREFTAAVSYPAIVERYRALILEPATTTPEEFRSLIESDLARWGKVVREAGIKAL